MADLAADVEDFVEELLEAAGLPDEIARDTKLEGVYERCQQLHLRAQAAAIATIGAHSIYLRNSWSAKLGVILLSLVQRTATSNYFDMLSVLRLLEGLLLICCLSVEERSYLCEILDTLLRRRRLPTAFARMEAVMIFLSGRPVNPVPPLEQSGSERLAGLAESLKPSEESLQRLRKTMDRVCSLVPQVFEGQEAKFFGSAVNGFQNNASDIDVVVPLSEQKRLELIAKFEEDPERKHISKTKACATAAVELIAAALRENEDLKDCGIRVKEVITEARVPIVKCESDDGIEVDLSFNNSLPLHNSQLLRAYADWDTRIWQLGMLVKHWAKRRHVNDAMDGTLSSYSHILLMIHYAQRAGVAPSLQDKSLVSEDSRSSWGHTELLENIHDVWFLDPSSKPEDTTLPVQKAPEDEDTSIQALLFGFFQYWAYEFPFYSHVASVKSKGPPEAKVDFFRAEEVEIEDVELEEKLGMDLASPLNNPDSPPLLPVPLSRNRFYSGTIKSFDDGNGFGFIENSELMTKYGKDVFLHRSQFQDLNVGDRCAFRFDLKKGQPQAKDVRGLGEDEELPEAPEDDDEDEVIELVLEPVDLDPELLKPVYAGNLKSFEEERGFGFIECEEIFDLCSKDVFIHKAQKPKDLEVGDRVAFGVTVKDGNPQARNVTPLGADEQLPELLEGGEPIKLPVNPDAPSKFQVPKHVYAAQKRLGNRLCLCIEDPFEKNRTLGTSFQGTERLFFELRRGAEILSEGFGEQQIQRLFLEEPKKSLHKLASESHFKTTAFEARQRGPQHVTHKMDVPRKEVGKILGFKGATVKALREQCGVANLHVDGLDRTDGGCPSIKIRGEKEAVEHCIAEIEKLLQQQDRERDKGRGKNSGNGAPQWAEKGGKGDRQRSPPPLQVETDVIEDYHRSPQQRMYASPTAAHPGGHRPQSPHVVPAINPQSPQMQSPHMVSPTEVRQQSPHVVSPAGFRAQSPHVVVPPTKLSPRSPQAGFGSPGHAEYPGGHLLSSPGAQRGASPDSQEARDDNLPGGIVIAPRDFPKAPEGGPPGTKLAGMLGQFGSPKSGAARMQSAEMNEHEFPPDMRAPSPDSFAMPQEKGKGKGGDIRPGDWTCPNCGINVFASKNACFKCGTRKEERYGGEVHGYGTRGPEWDIINAQKHPEPHSSKQWGNHPDLRPRIDSYAEETQSTMSGSQWLNSAMSTDEVASSAPSQSGSASGFNLLMALKKRSDPADSRGSWDSWQGSSWKDSWDEPHWKSRWDEAEWEDDRWDEDDGWQEEGRDRNAGRAILNLVQTFGAPEKGGKDSGKGKTYWQGDEAKGKGKEKTKEKKVRRQWQ